jgi:hypothetical protein
MMTRKVFFSLLMLTVGVTVVWAGDFNHQAHLEEYVPGTACSECHIEGAESIVPSTKVCLDCHSQDLVDEVSLRLPKTHGPVWSLNHRTEAKGRAIDCAACHSQEYCLECHRSGFADEMGELGNNMINVHRDDFHVSHPIAARTDQNLCSSCHESRFCSECHNAWRFRTEDIGSPSHRRTFNLGFEDADIDAIHAGIESSQCDSCHLQSSVAPNFHSWSIGHAREARKSLITCQSCHPDGDICLNCHSAKGGAGGYNPHPRDWKDFEGRLDRASNGRTCRKCH